MKDFQGTSRLALDAKGRISVPSRHRDQLQLSCEGRLTLTRHPDGCLLVYPRPYWELKRQHLATLPYSARSLQRLLLGSAIDADLDGAGRLLIPSGLREDAKLTREAALVGMGAYFELWEPEAQRAREASDLADGIPPSAGDFTF